MDEWKFKPARDFGLTGRQRLNSLRRESSLVESLTHLAWWSLVRAYLQIGHRLTIEGRDNVPAEAPFILVANHCSHLDALVLGSILPLHLRDCIFPIAAGDTFFETPIVSAFAAGCMNALPLWRRNTGAQALEQLRQRLMQEPCAYILFPEGTRSRNGHMADFKAGIGKLVAQTPVPVVPCALSGTFRAWPPGRKWPAFHKITLRLGEPLSFASINDDRAGWRHIAASLETAVRRLHPEWGTDLQKQFEKSPGE